MLTVLLPLPSALMQLASARRLLLMLAPSRIFWPVLPVSAARSDPAKSTIDSFASILCRAGIQGC